MGWDPAEVFKVQADLKGNGLFSEWGVIPSFKPSFKSNIAGLL